MVDVNSKGDVMNLLLWNLKTTLQVFNQHLPVKYQIKVPKIKHNIHNPAFSHSHFQVGERAAKVNFVIFIFLLPCDYCHHKQTHTHRHTQQLIWLSSKPKIIQEKWLWDRCVGERLSSWEEGQGVRSARVQTDTTSAFLQSPPLPPAVALTLW